MQRFTELRVWQRSHALVLGLYRATARFPNDGRVSEQERVYSQLSTLNSQLWKGSA